MNSGQVNLCLVLHNHQPIGNFDNVFEQAYQDSYLPFLDVFETYPRLKISLHTSGCLMQWLDERHPEYLDRLAVLASHGRVEIIGGAFYEPILTMIPSRDRIGQITSFTRWLERRLATKVQGMWIPERVWESSLTSDLAAADIQYTVLDDFHFRCAGLTEDELHGYYVTEDQGRVMRVFPGSERLRYLIPFRDPQETIDYCRQLGQRFPGCVVTFGDDGEKFGTWPETKKHVYDGGWLRRFFDALEQNADWLVTTTLVEAVERNSPWGKVYLPDASYREMTEWALPVPRQLVQQELIHDLEHAPLWGELKNFVRGGYWRNFKVKYPESNEMYARMMFVSALVQQAEQEGCPADVLRQARQWLYQGQCNCSYWHGAFGGVYLPHLRNAVYQNLIASETAIENWSRGVDPWVEATVDDYNYDGDQEVRLANDQLSLWISPQTGGSLYELDVRKNGHNLLATMQRRPEAYHQKILQANAQQQNDGAASIHDRVVLKRNDLETFLQYDNRLRKTMIDHFYRVDETLVGVEQGRAPQLGDFSDGQYHATVRRNPNRIQVMLTRQGNVEGHSIRITKGLTLNSGSDTIEIGYLLEGLPQEQVFHLGIEFNFAGLPDGADDRYYSLANGDRIGQLGTQQDLRGETVLRLHDEWLGLQVSLQFAEPTDVWAYPVRAVSQSESGFELVHQSVVVQPHWQVVANAQGQWSTRLQLQIGCQKKSEPVSGRHETLAAF
ncbi:MAG: alpha-amylase/4-alpha-glucanotransferase domain-containing protein [Pirellulaceae bacterium]